MRTLAEHIYDLAQNSVRARAESVSIRVVEDIAANTFTLIVEDDGEGIKPENLPKVTDTFFSTRPKNLRRVGLGLALLEATCQRTGGKLDISSAFKKGTIITAVMQHDNIDRPPLGDITDVYTSLMLSTVENKIIWTLGHEIDGRGYSLRNRAVLDELGLISFHDSEAKHRLVQLVKKKEKELAD